MRKVFEYSHLGGAEILAARYPAIDAAIDEANVGRFVEALRALEKKTQFIIITHNPRTIEAADAIYGVTMGADNTSRVLSLRLDDVQKS